MACLVVLDERAVTTAAKCSPEHTLTDPAKTLVALSGGSAGAPGFRPGEVLLAGLLATPGEVLVMTPERALPVDGSSGVFVVATALQVEAIQTQAGFTTVHTCQRC